MQETRRRHHFVPKLLQKPFCTGGTLLFCRWDSYRNQLSVLPRSPRSILFERDLFRISNHPEGEDVLERRFFESIDNAGSKARDVLIREGPNGLTVGQRTDFARLLLSLEARRPEQVSHLRRSGEDLAEQLDADRELMIAFEKEGVQEKPSEFWKLRTNTEWSDELIPALQKMVDNSRIGRVIINMVQLVKVIDGSDGEFILSDRPLVRYYGTGHQECTWFLPLGPQVAWLGSRNPQTIEAARQMTGRRFVKEANRSSMNNTSSFVLGKTERNRNWIEKHIPRNESDD